MLPCFTRVVEVKALESTGPTAQQSACSPVSQVTISGNGFNVLFTDMSTFVCNSMAGQLIPLFSRGERKVEERVMYTEPSSPLKW